MKNIRQEAKSWFKTILFFLFFRSFVASAYEIQGSCMQPQLQNADRVVVNKLIYRFRQPHIGDILVFPFPLDPKKDFVKRLVGLPGDTVEVKDGALFRNGNRIIENFVPEPIWGRFGPRKVPPGKFLVMGDNRNNSFDSRAWGFVDQNNVVGKVEARFWPPSRIGRTM